MATEHPTGQDPTQQQAESPREPQLADDPRMASTAEDDWNAFEGADSPEAIYRQQGDPARPAAGDQTAAQDATSRQAPESLNDVDLAAMSVDDRVQTVRAYLGADVPEQKALDIADGYMRDADYRRKTQALAADRRQTQQGDISLLDGQDGVVQPPQRPIGPQQPMQMQQPQQAQQGQQSEVPGPPPGTIQPTDRNGFARWWTSNMDSQPTEQDYTNWYHDQTFGQMQRQQQAERVQQNIAQVKSEWDEIKSDFSHASEPGVEDQVEAELVRRLNQGIYYPGMVREIYMGRFGPDAVNRQRIETAQQGQQPQQGAQQPPQRRQAPPVPPGGPGGAPQQGGQERELKTDEAIMAKQLGDDGLLSRVEGSLELEESVYRRAAGRDTRR